MRIYTTWMAYNGEVGITHSGDYYEMSTGKQMQRCEHQGSLYYRVLGSKKRYSYRKCNKTKIKQRVEVVIMPF